uniref:Uncharacterized protein n=1 Tax=Ciona intestinalis TaxID=7719 RepID=H2XR72_CIOIN
MNIIFGYKATSKVGEFEIKLKTLNQNERKLKQYEDKVKRLEAENKEKENLLNKENKSSAAKYNIRVKVLEEQLNDLTRETTNHEMELQSISSQQITKLRTMEGKVKQLETENKSKQRELLQEQVVRLKREVKDKDDFIQQVRKYLGSF